MNHFNDVANEWDNESKVKMMKILANESKKFIDLKAGLRILDFGCGTGLFGLEFAQDAKSFIGVDTSEGMLSVLDKKIANRENFSSKLIDIEKEDFEDEFDLIVTSMAFHHLVNPEKVLQKLVNCLTPSGTLLLVDLDQEDGTFHPDNEAMGVKHFGFGVSTIESWAERLNLKLDYHLINKIEKNESVYHQFLAIFRR